MKDKIVKEWFERDKHDLDVAKITFSHGDYYDVVMFLLQQAVEKYLKGFLISKGWKLKKIHDIHILLSEAIKFNESLSIFLDFGKKLTAFYYEERYPPGPIPYVSKEEAEEMLNTAEKLIEKIKIETSL
jgi:HEPN domain-containing protein